MKKWFLGGVFLGFILIALIVWKNLMLFSPISCSSFIDSRLHKVSFLELKLGSKSDWINENFYPLKINYFIAMEDINEEWHWASLTNRYSLYSIRENIRFKQSWKYSTVTIRDMLRCLGEPDAYINVAEVGHDAYFQNILFLYPDYGYVVTVSSLFSKDPPSIDETTPLTYVEIVPSGSAEDMVENVYALETENNRNKWIDAIEQWPGDINNMELIPTLIRKELDFYD